MKRIRFELLIVLAVGLLAPACQTAEAPRILAMQAAGTGYLSEAQTQRLMNLLPGPFPHAPGATPAEIAELDQMISDAEVQVIRGVQADTSAQARARADRVEDFDPVWDFDVALGRHFNKAECPAINHLFDRAAPEVAEIKDAAKKKFGRARPPESGLTSNDSYPSGHSTRAFFRARVLIEIAPDRKNDILKAARAMVVNRIIAGKHHPSDCAAGIVLGTAIAEAMLDSAGDAKGPMHNDLEAAKKEWKEVSSKADRKQRGRPGA